MLGTGYRIIAPERLIWTASANNLFSTAIIFLISLWVDHSEQERSVAICSNLQLRHCGEVDARVSHVSMP